MNRGSRQMAVSVPSLPSVAPGPGALRLGIDLDGVVADFNLGWMRRYNAQFDRALEPALVRRWDDLYTHTHFPSMEAFWAWAESDVGSDVDGQGSFFRELEPYPGAIETLRRLDERGHRVVILSHKPQWAVHDTLAWLAEHRLPTREVHLTDVKWKVDCDVYLDDGNHNLDAFLERRPGAVVCRFVQPWNEAADNLVDIDSWDAFHELVASLETERTS